MGFERNDEQIEDWLGEVKLRCLKIEKLTEIMDQCQDNLSKVEEILGLKHAN